MLIRDILLEYDRDRARQALGDSLWLAWVAEVLGIQGHSQEDIRREAEADPRFEQILRDKGQQDVLSNNALERIERADPSTNKQYTQWMARMFANGSEPWMEDVTSTLADYVAKFHKLKTRKRLPPGENDINRYRSAKQLYLVMDRYEDPADADGEQGSADKVYEDGDVTVVVPRDKAAACRYGRQTRWCTAAVHGSNYFDQYNSQGPLYIVIPKHPRNPGAKYQLHFQSGSFMDEDDEPINLGYFLRDQYPGLLEFFMSKPDIAEQLREMVQFTPDELLQELSDRIWDLAQDPINDILADWEANDDSYHQFLRSEGYEDGEGNIDWDRAPSYDEYNDDARRWAMDMEEYCHPSPDQLREMAAEQSGDGTYDEDSIYNLEGYIAHNLRHMMRREHSGDHIADWIDRNIHIRKTPDGPRVERIKSGNRSGKA